MNTQETQHILDELQSIDQFSHKEAFDKVRTNIKRRKTRRQLYFISSVASAAAVVLLVFWMQFNTLVITNDSNTPLTHQLPDGSSVEINSNAEITYKRDFKNKRDLHLSGEAFFDVTRDAKHPFVIKVGNSEVRVLGTSFNVREYKVSNKVEVFVKSGKVLLSNEEEFSLELTASQMGSTGNNQIKQIVQQDINYLSWKDRKLIFIDSQLPYVIQSLQNTYHTDISILEEELNSLRLSTTFHHMTIEEVMTSICLTLDLQQEKTPNGYTLSHK